MTRYTLHIPETLNDGAPVRPDQLAAIESQLLDVVGGFTQTLARGAWRGDGHTYIEPIRLYLIDVPQDLNGDVRRALRDLAQEIGADLAQEAVYLTRQEIESHFVAPLVRS